MTPAGTYRDTDLRAPAIPAFLRAYRDAVVARNLQGVSEMQAADVSGMRTVDSAGDDFNVELFIEGKVARGYGNARQQNGG